MTGMNFTRSARETLAAAVQDARRRHHEFIGPEHMLSAMLRDPANEAGRAIAALGVDVPSVLQQLDGVVTEGTAPESGLPPTLPYTTRAKNVLEGSMAEARELRHQGMGALHLLAGMLREGKGIPAQLLSHAGVTLEGLRAHIHDERDSSEGGAKISITTVQVSVQRADGSVSREEFPDTMTAIHYLSRQ